MTFKLKFLIVTLLVSVNTFAQERKIVGRVLDRETQKPIKNANIGISGKASGAFSNQLGFFELTIDPSKHKTLIVSHIGFRISEILIPPVDRFKFFLEKEYILLDQLNISLYPRKRATAYNSVDSMSTNNGDLLVIESGAMFPDGIDNFYNFIGNSLASNLSEVNEKGFNITFTIDERGQAVEISISDSTLSIEMVVMEAFEKMPAWTPASQRQNNIPQHFILPVVRLGMPDIRSLDLGDLYKFISRNTRYPAQARRMGVEGAVYLEFQIDRSGNVLSNKLLRDIGAGCGEEVRR